MKKLLPIFLLLFVSTIAFSQSIKKGSDGSVTLFYKNGSSDKLTTKKTVGEGDIGTIANWASPGSKKYRWVTIDDETTFSWYITSTGGSASTNTTVFYFPLPADAPIPVNFPNQPDVTGSFVATGHSLISNNNSIASNAEFEEMTALGYSSSILNIYVRCASSAKTVWMGSVTYRSK